MVFIYLGCHKSNTGIKADKEFALKRESSENEFHCQQLCRNNYDCKIFYWNQSMQHCQLFSNLANSNLSIIDEPDSVIGQPDCFNMDPLWPESLINTNSIEEKRGIYYFKLL